jgi:hypothetical protein
MTFFSVSTLKNGTGQSKIISIAGEKVEASVIPAVVYKNAVGVETNFDAADTDKVIIPGGVPIIEKATVITVSTTSGVAIGTTKVSALPGDTGSTLKYNITSSAVVLAPMEGQAESNGLLDFVTNKDMLITIGNYIHIYEIKGGVVTGYGEIKVLAGEIKDTVAPVNLGSAGNYAILAKTAISSVPNSSVTGNIGVSPIGATGITGFSLTADATNVFSTSNQITGMAYASNYASTTPSNLTTAVSNMETAFIDAAGRAAKYTELHAGDISGKTLTAGVYKWGTGVLINSDVTLNGGANDVFIFQVAKGIKQANGTKIILTGGVQAKNIFWQSAETVSIGTGAHFEGIILSKTNITMGTKASINGRLLAQTAVTLDQSTVVAP